MTNVLSGWFPRCKEFVKAGELVGAVLLRAVTRMTKSRFFALGVGMGDGRVARDKGPR